MKRRLGWSILSAISVVTLWLAEASLPAAEIVVEKDIVYGTGGGKDLKLNLARPEHPNGLLPAIVYIHGGGWQGGSREMYRSDIEQAAKRGYVAVTISYRLTDPDAQGKAKHPFPAQVEDVKCAVRWLRANSQKYHIDPNRIGATGGSAGGHLSLMLGVLGGSNEFEGNGGNPGVSSQVQAVVNYFGPTDLTRLHSSSKRVAAILDVLLDGPPEQMAASYRAASPITYVSKSDPPTLTLHGTADPIVPVDQATELDAAMKKAGAPHTLMLMEGEGHGFKPAADKQAREATFKFFDAHLKNKS
jgi:acetyl esterase/lipase